MSSQTQANPFAGADITAHADAGARGWWSQALRVMGALVALVSVWSFGDAAQHNQARFLNEHLTLTAHTGDVIDRGTAWLTERSGDVWAVETEERLIEADEREQPHGEDGGEVPPLPQPRFWVAQSVGLGGVEALPWGGGGGDDVCSRGRRRWLWAPPVRSPPVG